MRKRLLLVPVVAAVAAGIAITASTTGANFSGTSNTGTISGSNAVVKVSGGGGNGGS